jgi:hypothetical protein
VSVRTDDDVETDEFTCNVTVNAVTPQYAISLSSNPTNGGTTSGGGTYDGGTSRTVTATANPGFTFVNWTEGGTAVSTSASYTFTLNGNRNLVANFESTTVTPPTKYTLTVNNGTGSGSYPAGTVVNISANTPPINKVFDKWTGDVSGVAEIDSASTTYTMGSANATITATYKDDQTANGHIESGNGVKIHTEGSSLTVKSDNIELKSVEIYHVSGQLLRSIRTSGAGIRIENLPRGVLIIKISLQGGRIETKKVRIR